MPSSRAQTGEAGAQENPQPYPETTKLLPTPSLLERQKEGAAHTPSGMWSPLLCLLKFCRWKGKQFECRIGWYFSFMQMHSCLKSLSAFHYLWNSQRQNPRLPSVLCMTPNALRVVNKCHITSFCTDWEWHFPVSLACFDFSANLTKCIHFPEKGYSLRPVFLAWISSPNSHQCFTHLSPGPVDSSLPFPHPFYSFSTPTCRIHV